MISADEKRVEGLVCFLVAVSWRNDIVNGQAV